MDLKINKNHTTYRLYIDIPEAQTITVGKLGTFLFKKGVYIYVGSAKKNIVHRMKRHLIKEKTKRWHIDYVREHGDLFYYETFENEEECELARKTIRTFNGQCPYRKLGSSDCHCFSHLIYCPDFIVEDEQLKEVFKKYKDLTDTIYNGIEEALTSVLLHC